MTGQVVMPVLDTLVAGVYCLGVEEDLSYEMREVLENKNINYRIRDDKFYPPEHHAP